MAPAADRQVHAQHQGHRHLAAGRQQRDPPRHARRRPPTRCACSPARRERTRTENRFADPNAYFSRYDQSRYRRKREKTDRLRTNNATVACQRTRLRMDVEPGT